MTTMQQQQQQNLKDPDVGVVILDTSVSPDSTASPAARSALHVTALIAEGLTASSLWAGENQANCGQGKISKKSSRGFEGSPWPCDQP